MPIILIVDDSKTIQKQVTKFAELDFPDFEVVKFSSGEEALEIIPTIKDDISVAIVDYNMNGMNGLELIDKIKHLIPVNKIILCTANIQETIKGKAQNIGIHFKEKPLTIENFKPTLSEVLGAK